MNFLLGMGGDMLGDPAEQDFIFKKPEIDVSASLNITEQPTSSWPGQASEQSSKTLCLKRGRERERERERERGIHRWKRSHS
jgi:hypothetical protein